ncbi:hypothetical protein L249_7880 [Ophiocordyceps polyrhachis-furcata BCC 54312]|uniref:Uncharacterized protein n=1 Tax=Ophiocordyceps polyrhachis-furcata BCC 54312 TaxID=1330021 RepID=A0A367L0U4_9HYPO|nr:hypothetical protein L249_7880 [Ophiocordyceps polyrhachis-furcata BCC 54312]
MDAASLPNTSHHLQLQRPSRHFVVAITPPTRIADILTGFNFGDRTSSRLAMDVLSAAHGDISLQIFIRADPCYCQ